MAGINGLGELPGQCLTVWRLPPCEPVARIACPDHEVLYHEIPVALEPRAWRDRLARLDDLLAINLQLPRLAPGGRTASPGWLALLRTRVAGFASLLMHTAGLESRPLLLPLEHRDFVVRMPLLLN